MKRLPQGLLILACLCLIVPAVEGAEESGTIEDLTELTLEELLDIEVTSVSKKAESLSDAAAAVFVITREDIKRSGATSIPEALRLAPGVHVARMNASTWAITVRGFSERWANKLLVLIDGRTVYSPLFSGVWWNEQDTLLEDVERIEVIRGPGAALWGANAVNGVINVITRNARDTEGGYLEGGFGSVRYGDRVGDDFHWRIFARYFDRDSSVDASGEEANDAWDALRGGFRTDWDVSERDDLYAAFLQDTITLLEDRLHLTLGSKFEHNDYTGYEVQPTLRLMWKLPEDGTLWAAVSRAVRTPNRTDRDSRINFVAFPDPTGMVNLISSFGNEDFESEELIAYEIGGRWELGERTSLDIAGYYNDYDSLESRIDGEPFIENTPPPSHLVHPRTRDNQGVGRTYGLEVVSEYRASDSWRLRAVYSFLQMDLSLKSNDASVSRSPTISEDGDPSHQFSFWSTHNPWEKLGFDVILRYVDEITHFEVDQYLTMDLRPGWQITPDVELALVGQNLLEDQHAEYGTLSPDFTITEVERGVYAKLAWNF